VARRFRFRQVDVFTDRPLHGNPLAVFPDARRLTDGEMQALAREMNLSETCFVLPPTEAGRAAGADYRLRIFTPGVELPFAGHPSIGAAWVLADEGRLPLHAPRTMARAELAIGVLPISIAVESVGATGKSRAGTAGTGKARAGEVTMTQGRPDIQQRMEDDEIDELCEALEVARSAIGWPKVDGGRRRHVSPTVVSTGLPHLIVPFVERAVMMDVDPERREHVAEICSSYGCDSAALVAPGNSGTIADADVCVRVLDAGTFKIDADPATGAAAGPIAVFLGSVAGVHGTFRVVIEQGVEVGRPSRLAAEADFGASGRPEEVRVSGRVVPVIEGWVTLP
jgi:trans-2,3-dihydro-3-hydroxyanthranilate isomerase